MARPDPNSADSQTGHARFTRDDWLSYLPPVLMATVLRAFVAERMVFRPDGSQSIVIFQKDAIAVALVVGLPIVFIFVLIRLWNTRNARRTFSMIGLSLATCAAILHLPLGELNWRLHLNKARYDAIAAQRADAPVVTFDWGDGPEIMPVVNLDWRYGPVVVPFGHVKEYLIVARGSAAATLDHFAGREIDSWGDEREEVDHLLMSGWNGEGSALARFRQGHFDACRMHVSHLVGQYYYAADWC